MFTIVKKQMQEAFLQLVKNQSVLFITELDKDKLWETYLNGFSDPIEKQEHNCHCCRHFIKNYGNVVAIVDNKLVSIWNFEAPELFKPSVKALNELVLGSVIRDVFISDVVKLGTEANIQRFTTNKLSGKQEPLGTPITWNHFSLIAPAFSVNRGGGSIEAKMGEYRDAKNVFKRSLDELTQDSVETILELIAQNSLYKGEENKGVLTEFLKQKKQYTKAPNKDNYAWEHSIKVGGSVAKIRNTSIGTLLTDISEGKDLDVAVGAFERIVAPTNYKRPTALVTKRMIEEAEKIIKELGYEESLGRRYATPEDISVSNLLFVDRDVKKAMGVFAEMKEEVAINPKTLKKVEEIQIDDFLKDILPTAKSVQLLLENGHLNNLCSVITEKVEKAPILFKWGNPFSWSYTNAMTDSIKEQVKAAGGKVDGDLRFSIQWNEDGKSIIDLDAHAHEPAGGSHIYYSSSFRKDRGYGKTAMTGQLDVDMINPSHIGIENIAWTDKHKMKEGNYVFKVHNFSGHRNFDGVRCEIECDGQIHNFSINKPFTGYMDIATVNYSKSKGFTVVSSLDGTSSVHCKEKWGLSTNKFYKVSMLMNSPNYWETKIGNKHTFFILEGAKNDELPRGFFNEFLKEELTKDRKVFEVLGGKLKVEPADKQLSGVGFSSTQRHSVICKVEGKFERLLKINF